MHIAAIAFDVYGTLAHIGAVRDPYRQLAERLGVDVARLGHLAMSSRHDLAGLARTFAPDNTLDLAPIEAELQHELASITLFPDVAEVVPMLAERGLRIAVISNLGPPYAAPIDRLLDGLIDLRVWSFAVGATKPDPAIFRVVCDRLEAAPDQVLMVGDRLDDDIEGGRGFGMPTRLLDRAGRHNHPGSLRTLHDLLPLLATL